MGWFEDKLLSWMKANRLFESVNKVLLAVSGGADSVAMACALHRLCQEGRLGCELVIGHVNHGLRGVESDGDEAFVRDLGQSLGISVLTGAVDVQAYAAANKLSIETAGRTLRLQALTAMAKEKNCDAIAVAHHQDDLAETMIHRLMRGTGFRGLCGIWPVSEVYGAKFIRPMLSVRRAEMIQYGTENHLIWREDASNRMIEFTRNRIRHRLLPALGNDSDSLVERLAALSLKSRLFLVRVEKQARSIFENGRLNQTKDTFILAQDLLRDCPPWVFYEVLRKTLVCLGVGLRHYKQEHFDSLRRLVEQKKVKADFPGGVEVAVEKGRVVVNCKAGRLTHRAESAGDSVRGDLPPCILEIGKTVQFGPWKISSRLFNRNEVDVAQFLKTKDAFVEWCDADKITGPIEIRRQREGDRFWPIGGKGEKKVARFLADAGLDTDSRQKVFIVADAEKILWLAPIRMSEEAKISDTAQKILQLSAREAGSSCENSHSLRYGEQKTLGFCVECGKMRLRRFEKSYF